MFKKHQHLIISLCVIVFLLLSTTVIVLYSKGFTLTFDKGKPEFTTTGLLVATSTPDGAQVFINGHLTTATNNTLNLIPGQYLVRIYKDGFFPWQKQLTIQKGIVSQADALLLPQQPNLESITLSGVQNPVLDPSSSKIAYEVASESATTKNGIYIFNMTNNSFLTINGATTQIVNDTVDNFSSSAISWSPDGSDLIATTAAKTTYLLNTNTFNNNPQDITETLDTFQATWQNDQQALALAKLNRLKPMLRKLVTADFKILAWSPDDTKILYSASNSATLPVLIKPAPIGANTTPEQRKLSKNGIYVYDIKEDKNFKLLSSLGNADFLWYPDSKHLVMLNNKAISLLEYDGNNKTVIYAGPFLNNFFAPWPDGSKIAILTNLDNLNTSANLYTISLK